MTNDDASAPDVLEAYWELDQVITLFADLEQHAEIRHVQVRSAADGTGGQDSQVSLAEARSLLEKQGAIAVQVYYRFDGKAWCDTLMPAAETIRIIRAVLPEDRLPG